MEILLGRVRAGQDQVRSYWVRRQGGARGHVKYAAPSHGSVRRPDAPAPARDSWAAGRASRCRPRKQHRVSATQAEAQEESLAPTSLSPPASVLGGLRQAPRGDGGEGARGNGRGPVVGRTPVPPKHHSNPVSTRRPASEAYTELTAEIGPWHRRTLTMGGAVPAESVPLLASDEDGGTDCRGSAQQADRADTCTAYLAPIA